MKPATLGARNALQATSIVGADEVGRGAWAGPIVACAVRITDCRRFPFSRVRDSKLLTDAERRALCMPIAGSCEVGYGYASHALIERLGVQAANVYAIDMALRRFSASAAELHSDYIGGFGAYTSLNKKITLHVRGETVIPQIAAASIMAKVCRDDLMLALPHAMAKYVFDRHKGYGTALHKRMLRRYGLSAIHRKSFVASYA